MSSQLFYLQMAHPVHLLPVWAEVLQLNNQGLLGALHQYWNIDEKPRLDRKNTYFDDVQVSNLTALRVGIVVSVVATAIIGLWSLGGIL